MPDTTVPPEPTPSPPASTLAVPSPFDEAQATLDMMDQVVKASIESDRIRAQDAEDKDHDEFIDRVVIAMVQGIATDPHFTPHEMKRGGMYAAAEQVYEARQEKKKEREQKRRREEQWAREMAEHDARLAEHDARLSGAKE